MFQYNWCLWEDHLISGKLKIVFQWLTPSKSLLASNFLFIKDYLDIITSFSICYWRTYSNAMTECFLCGEVFKFLPPGRPYKAVDWDIWPSSMRTDLKKIRNSKIRNRKTINLSKWLLSAYHVKYDIVLQNNIVLLQVEMGW